MMLYSWWLVLPLSTRNKLAETFGIPKKGSVQVDSNVVRHDGYNVEDIEKAITVATMQDYLQLESTDTEGLWRMTLDKIEGKEISVLQSEEAAQFKKERKARITKTVTVKATLKEDGKQD